MSGSAVFHLLQRHSRSIARHATRTKRAVAPLKMSFHFASSDYASCFLMLPQPDTEFMRNQAIEYLETFDKTTWFQAPVRRVSPCVINKRDSRALSCE
jgi:hypothetical protein